MYKLLQHIGMSNYKLSDLLNPKAQSAGEVRMF